jgi:hypothetical protein
MKNISLEKFRGLKAQVKFDKIMHKYSKKTKDILVTRSPKSGRAGRATPYYSGWVVDSEAVKNGYRDVVWNSTNWQLTHLLENGHFISNRGALGWAEPQKHIRQAYLDVRDSYIDAMRKAELEVDFK